LVDYDNIKIDEHEVMKSRKVSEDVKGDKAITEEKIKPKKHVEPIL